MDLIERHQDFFWDFGFRLDRAVPVFKKPIQKGSQLIFIHYTPYPDGAYLEYNLGIRIDEVEYLIHQFLPTLQGYSDQSVTLVQTLDKIGKELPKRFFIQHDGNLSKTLMSVEKFFVSHGFHWLDQMSDPVHLEKAFVDKNEKSFKTQNFIYNAFRGTALSKLYRPEDYPSLRETYLGLVQKKCTTPFNIASYLKFLDYLDNQIND
ncbi:hypothetical protein [Algoriphagus namhaensis]